LRLVLATEEAWLSFVPRPCAAPAILFKARGGRAEESWAGCAELEVVEVFGDHFTMLDEPHVGSLATRVRAVLGRGRPTAGAAPAHPRDAEDEYPISGMQRLMLEHASDRPGEGVYTVQRSLRLRDEPLFDLGAFR